jgi:hypothetical protein
MIKTETKDGVCTHVFFTNTDGKDFGMPRERIIHYETYCSRNDEGEEVFYSDKTYVNFMNPNGKKGNLLHAVVNMPVRMFYDQVIRPAYEG